MVTTHIRTKRGRNTREMRAFLKALKKKVGDSIQWTTCRSWRGTLFTIVMEGYVAEFFTEHQQ